MDTPKVCDEKRRCPRLGIKEGHSEDNTLFGSQVVIEPPKSGRLPQNQLTPVRNYSTVTDLARFLG